MIAPLHILFVCTANICRSAYAEVYARHVADRIGKPFTFSSAGTWGLQGHEMDPPMVRQLEMRNIDVEGFRSRQVTSQDVAEAGLVLTMEGAHRTFLLDDNPTAVDKIFILGKFAERAASYPELHGPALLAELARSRTLPKPQHDIRDPFRRGDAAAAEAAEQIGRLVSAVLVALG